MREPRRVVIHGGVMKRARTSWPSFIRTPGEHGRERAALRLACPITQHAVRFHNRIGYLDFAGFEFDLLRRERLVRDLEGKLMLVLRNHGVLSCGRSIPRRAYNNHHFFEMACQAQIAARLGRRGRSADRSIGRNVRTRCAAIRKGRPSRRKSPRLGALLRLADRLDPSYKD